MVNILAHTTAAGGLAYLLARKGQTPYAALIYSVFVGNLFAIRLDLNEPLCMALAVLAIIAYQHQRFRWAIFLLILSTLTKELGLVFAGGMAFHAFFYQRGWSILIFAGPMLTFLSWWLVLWSWFGDLPTRYPAGRIRYIPFNGMFSTLEKENLTEPELLFGLTVFFLGLPAIVFGLLALWTMWRERTLTLSMALVFASARICSDYARRQLARSGSGVSGGPAVSSGCDFVRRRALSQRLDVVGWLVASDFTDCLDSRALVGQRDYMRPLTKLTWHSKTQNISSRTKP